MRVARHSLARAAKLFLKEHYLFNLSLRIAVIDARVLRVPRRKSADEPVKYRIVTSPPRVLIMHQIRLFILVHVRNLFSIYSPSYWKWCSSKKCSRSSILDEARIHSVLKPDSYSTDFLFAIGVRLKAYFSGTPLLLNRFTALCTTLANPCDFLLSLTASCLRRVYSR